jgi:hypothetical protein
MAGEEYAREEREKSEKPMEETNIDKAIGLFLRGKAE